MNGKKFCTLQVKGELTCVNLSLALFWQELVVVVVTVNFSLIYKLFFIVYLFIYFFIFFFIFFLYVAFFGYRDTGYKLFVRFIFIHSCMNCTSALQWSFQTWTSSTNLFYSNLFKFGCILVVYGLTQKRKCPLV